MGGVYAANFWKHWDGEKEIVTDPEACTDAFRETTKNMVDIFGDRWYGELQWHTDKKQHLINKLVIQPLPNTHCLEGPRTLQATRVPRERQALLVVG
jgi:hypothetical protein